MPPVAVILARGLGSRMRRDDAGAALDPAQAAAAAAGHKALMPVGRPLIEHLLTAVADAGLREAVLVVAPGDSPLRRHLAAHPPSRLAVAFAEQAEPRGTADAVAGARDAVGGRAFLVLNGDMWIPPEAIRMVAEAPPPAFGAFDADALTAHGNIPAGRVAAFAVCDVRDGALVGIVEKPAADDPLLARTSRVVSLNLWHLPASAFGPIAAVPPSPRGERELPDGVRTLVRAGIRVAAVPLACGALDVSARGDVASAAAALAGRRVAY